MMEVRRERWSRQEHVTTVFIGKIINAVLPVRIKMMVHVIVGFISQINIKTNRKFLHQIQRQRP